MLVDLIHMLGCVALVLGAFFAFTGALGVVRMPDFFTRLHPAGLVDAFGVPLMLVGLMLQHGLTLFTAKLALLFLFLWVTSATASHALAKAAAISGVKPWEEPLERITGNKRVPKSVKVSKKKGKKQA